MTLGQIIELAGMAVILASLLVQFWAVGWIEWGEAEVRDIILEERLRLIYLKLESPTVLNPPAIFEDVKRRFLPLSKFGHYNFADAMRFLRIVSAALFLVGSAATLIGKYMQYSGGQA
jgi:hypothetical protein